MGCHIGQSRDTIHLPQISPPNLRKGCCSDGSCTSTLDSFLYMFVCFSSAHFCCFFYARSLVFFLSICVFICVFFAINIAQQSRGPELSYLFLFISMWLLSCFLCRSLMDNHANALSPINISLWMLLSLRYEGVLGKGQQHSRGPKVNNSKKHRIFIIVNKASMNFSFFSTTLDLHHQIPFSAHFLSCLFPLPYFVKIFLNAPLISAITLNLLC
jgi:hypothetical protein